MTFPEVRDADTMFNDAKLELGLLINRVGSMCGTLRSVAAHLERQALFGSDRTDREEAARLLAKVKAAMVDNRPTPAVGTTVTTRDGKTHTVLKVMRFPNETTVEVRPQDGSPDLVFNLCAVTHHRFPIF